VSEPPQPDRADTALARAELIAENIERRAAELLSALIVRAVEEAQDIWAEAVSLHRQQRPG
jgi:hypothetical protein